MLGDGGVYSSIVDLYKWDQALYTDKLISRDLLKQAFTVHSKRSDFADSGYGFGWYIGRHHGTEMIWHYGSTCGFATWIGRVPEKQLSFIILTNRRDIELAPVGKQLADLYLK